MDKKSAEARGWSAEKLEKMWNKDILNSKNSANANYIRAKNLKRIDKNLSKEYELEAIAEIEKRQATIIEQAIKDHPSPLREAIKEANRKRVFTNFSASNIITMAKNALCSVTKFRKGAKNQVHPRG